MDKGDCWEQDREGNIIPPPPPCTQWKVDGKYQPVLPVSCAFELVYLYFADIIRYLWSTESHFRVGWCSHRDSLTQQGLKGQPNRTGTLTQQ